MNEQLVDRLAHQLRHVPVAIVAVLVMLALFLFVHTLSSMKAYSLIGAGVQATNTITVTGEGEVFAVPDIATFTLSIEEEAKDVAAAQEVATEKANDIIAYLRSVGIEERDIKTTSYNVQPRYDWIQETCVAGRPCEPGTRTLAGFTVSQTLTVKVRDTDTAGDVLSQVGQRGVSYVSGLSFTIDDEDALKADARALAIAEAKTKAQELAADLGVDLIRIVGFYENTGGYPEPYYERSFMTMDSAMGMGGEATSAPDLPVGENQLNSNVSVTYEVR
jgi:hypothetical protein